MRTRVLDTEKVRLYQGDALEVLKGCLPAYFDSMVTDPPAGISFMGRTWDRDHGGREGWIKAFAAIFSECFRAIKPGGHALVWALPRTSHWTATALEDAGFEIRDVVVHLFGTGFPKSLDVSKAIDKAAGECSVTAPATEAARQWEGCGTALKPASEHWILCRKPLVGTVAANVLEHGTGALNIDGCRVKGLRGSGWEKSGSRASENRAVSGANYDREPKPNCPAGRWPPNLLLTHSSDCGDECAKGCPVREMDRQSGESVSGTGTGTGTGGIWSPSTGQPAGPQHGDRGGASRFFPRFRYVAKASSSERNAGLPEGKKNQHPTVKSIALMRWLCRLVTPPGGLVLDPFAGSGSTLVAALEEGFQAVGIEREAEYAELAAARVKHVLEEEK